MPERRAQAPALTVSLLISTVADGSLGLSASADAASAIRARVAFWQRSSLIPQSIYVAGAVHGSAVAVVPNRAASLAADGTRLLPGVDALITARADLSLMMVYADCLPVVLYDPVNGALGLIHAGWRGTLVGVVERALEAMRGTFGSDLSRMQARFGPSICGRCYQVGEEVVELARRRLGVSTGAAFRIGARWHFDLAHANREILESQGVEVIPCDSCTYESELYFSHRRRPDGSRFALVARLC